MQTTTKSNTDQFQLSFVKVQFKGRRNQRVTDWFAVPDESYGDGNTTGFKVAAELMAYVQATTNNFVLREVIEAAGKVRHDTDVMPCSADIADRRGAAVTFLNSMADFIHWSASNCDHQLYLATKVKQQIDFQIELAAEREKDKQALIARLQKARALKRVAKAGAAAFFGVSTHA